MKKINQELIALFDKYGSDRRRALRENKKLSYSDALADLRENLLTGSTLTRTAGAADRGGRGRADRAACQTFIIGNGVGCFRRKSGGSTSSFQDRAGAGGEDPLCLCGCGDVCEGSGKGRRDIWICSADRGFDGGR